MAQNPFANKTFPDFGGDPERPVPPAVMHKVETFIGKLMTRAYDPKRDSKKRRSNVYTNIVEQSGGVGAFVDVPEMHDGGEVVLNLGNDMMVVATLPLDAQPGDRLRVVLDKNGTLQCVDRTEQGAMNLQPIRVVNFTLTVVITALMIIAVLIPYWVKIVSPKGDHAEFVGPWGRHTDGFMQPWSQVKDWCKELEAPGMSTRGVDVHYRCQVYPKLAKLGNGSIIILGLCMLLQGWGSISVLIRRELIGLIATLAAVCGEIFVVFQYTASMKWTIRNNLEGYKAQGMGFSTWLVVAASVIGLLQCIAIFAIWLEGSRNRNLRVQGVDVLAAMKYFVYSDERREREEGQYEWDETDPGAGCPLVWRTYGLTPAGLFGQYRGYWWGPIYASAVYLLSVPFHFIKTFDWNGIRRIWYGPPSEEKPIRKQGVQSTVVINYMLYRRSNIIMAVVFTLPLLIWTAKCMWEQQGNLMDSVNAQEAGASWTFPEYEMRKSAIGQNATFYDYSIEMLTQGMTTVTLSSETLEVWKQIMRIIMLLFAFLFAFAGMLKWHDFNASRYLLLLGWLAILILPFLNTLIPTSNFIRWRHFDHAVQRYANEARAFYEIDDFALQCLDLDIPSMTDMITESAEKACKIVRKHVPYKMEEYRDVTILGKVWSLPIHQWLKRFLGDSLPPVGTDLSAVHTLCARTTQVLDSDTFTQAVDMVHKGCQEVTSFLYQHTSPDHWNSLDAIRSTSNGEPGPADLSHVVAPFSVELTDDVIAGLPAGKQVAILPATNDTHFDTMAGKLVATLYPDDESCGTFDAVSKLVDKSIPIIMVAQARQGCSLERFRKEAKNVGVQWILLRDPDHLMIHDKRAEMTSSGNLPGIARIKNALDGSVLLDHLTRLVHTARGPDGGPSVVTTVWQPEWTPRHARTSYGCRCKARGYQSECVVRNSALFASHPEIKDQDLPNMTDFPWCETESTCPKTYDLCMPAGVEKSVVVKDAGKSCLPEFPCRRRHELAKHAKTQRPHVLSAPLDHDVCVVDYDPGHITDHVEFMDCVPPMGLAGYTEMSGKRTELEGTAVHFHAGFEYLTLSGMLLASYDCKYRLHVESLSVLTYGINAPSAWIETVGSRIVGHHSHYFVSGNEFDFKEEWAGGVVEATNEQNVKEVDVVIHVRSVRPASVELQMKCAMESHWRVVPADRLRYVPGAEGRAGPPPLALADKKEDRIAKIGRSFVQRAAVLTAPTPHGPRAAAANRSDEGGSDLAVRPHRRAMASPSGTLSLDDESSASEDRESVPGALCQRFVGTRCSIHDRCGSYEVCDLSWRVADGRRGFCQCAPGSCWDSIRRQCVPEMLRAKAFVSNLLSEQTFVEQASNESMAIVKGITSTLLSATSGLKNLNSVMGHVLALGPGLLISAWTAKLIFAHSSVPGYFCYFFPWIYAPMAWGLYSLLYQMVPDVRLFVGLAILSFWSVLLGMLTLYYGLHKPMSVPRMMSVVNNLLVIYYMMLLVGYSFLLWFAFALRPRSDNGIVGQVIKMFDEDFSISKAMMYALSTVKASYIITWLVDSFAVFFFTCCAATDFFIVMVCREHHEAWRMQQRDKALSMSAAPSAAMTPAMTPESKSRTDTPASPSEATISLTFHTADSGGSAQAPHPAAASSNAPPTATVLTGTAAALPGASATSGTSSEGKKKEEAKFRVEEDVIQDWLLLMRGPSLALSPTTVSESRNTHRMTVASPRRQPAPTAAAVFDDGDSAV
eukprot:TRINITY_DN37523_c0_g1_i1.p1 TRINITY_DN37523_c0_g1~~TRINITY_DN37523_c0_g1_i1.p1  ORF type:complete len:1735 (+),score=261.34 TRINITY_DN37523_c0_g1_i1:149-5353(+)